MSMIEQLKDEKKEKNTSHVNNFYILDLTIIQVGKEKKLK